MKNDSIPETFELKYNIAGTSNYFPVRYIKIVLLQSWGPSFNFCIWHVKLHGISKFKIVKPSIDWLNLVSIDSYKKLLFES